MTMTINEGFACPNCGGKSPSLLESSALFSDVRVDTLSCNVCQAQWKMYSKVSDVTTEVTHIPKEYVNERTEAVETEPMEEIEEYVHE